MRDGEALPHLVAPGEDDAEIGALIDSWRHAGPPTPWEAIVGHARQVRRAQEIVELMRRPAEDLARLRLETCRGLVIAGPAGVGKSLLGRAIATGAERDAIVVPTAELTPSIVTRLYRQLSRLGRPTIVLMDEAEGIIGQPYTGGDADSTRALCAAIDGIEPSRGPLTIALTTADAYALSPMATRAGRLAPRLELQPPSGAERLEILARAVEGLPVAGALDLPLVAERMSGWTGAMVVAAVSAACLRALPERVDALTQERLVEVAAEAYVIRDEPTATRRVDLVARHEAGHAVWSELHLPGQLEIVTIGENTGVTRLMADAFGTPLTYRELRLKAQIALAGVAADWITGGGRDGLTMGAEEDRATATALLVQLHALTTPYAVDVLEGHGEAGRGSERMRASLLGAVEQDAARLLDEVLAGLQPYRRSIERFADALLGAEDTTLSGDALRRALDATLGRS